MSVSGEKLLRELSNTFSLPDHFKVAFAEWIGKVDAILTEYESIMAAQPAPETQADPVPVPEPVDAGVTETQSGAETARPGPKVIPPDFQPPEQQEETVDEAQEGNQA